MVKIEITLRIGVFGDRNTQTFWNQDFELPFCPFPELHLALPGVPVVKVSKVTYDVSRQIAEVEAAHVIQEGRANELAAQLSYLQNSGWKKHPTRHAESFAAGQ
jgi:hypothetical protein